MFFYLTIENSLSINHHLRIFFYDSKIDFMVNVLNENGNHNDLISFSRFFNRLLEKHLLIPLCEPKCLYVRARSSSINHAFSKRVN